MLQRHWMVLISDTARKDTPLTRGTRGRQGEGAMAHKTVSRVVSNVLKHELMSYSNQMHTVNADCICYSRGKTVPIFHQQIIHIMNTEQLSIHNVENTDYACLHIKDA